MKRLILNLIIFGDLQDLTEVGRLTVKRTKVTCCSRHGNWTVLEKWANLSICPRTWHPKSRSWSMKDGKKMLSINTSATWLAFTVASKILVMTSGSLSLLFSFCSSLFQVFSSEVIVVLFDYVTLSRGHLQFSFLFNQKELNVKQSKFTIVIETRPRRWQYLCCTFCVERVYSILDFFRIIISFFRNVCYWITEWDGVT